MSTRKHHIKVFCTFILALSGCLEPYQPPTILQAVDILVVDGFLNTVEGSATVRLTLANALSDPNKTKPVVNAAVSIQTENGSTYPLLEQDTGTYKIAGLNIDPTTKYKLSVRTLNEDEYHSDYVETKPSPTIDSITWEAKDDGVNILVNAHDVTGNTNYYRWDYVETWEYHAPVSSDFILVNNEAVYRTADNRIFTCWRTVPSTKISIASTVRLAEDVIHDYPIMFLPVGSSKISVKYSILVQQRAISKNEFNFLEQLQKSTESLGGLFDPQPSEVRGNIHNLSNPSAPVLGYFSAGAVNQERFFLSFYDLPDHLKVLPRAPGCQVDSVCVVPGALMCTIDFENLSDSQILGTAVYSGPTIIGYTLSNPTCADCRVQGGTTTKPSFWP